MSDTRRKTTGQPTPAVKGRDQENEERFRKIFEEGPLGMAIVDANFCFVQINQTFCSLLGWERQALIGKTFKEITHPDHLLDDAKNVLRLRNNEIPVYKTEKRYLRKDGCCVWASTTISAIRDERGGLLNFLALVENIDERKRIVEALRKSEENYRLLVDNINIGVFQSTLTGKFIQANHATATITGFDSREELMAQSLKNAYVNPGDRARLLEILTRCGEVKNFEAETKRKNGDRMWISMNAVLVKDKEGKPEKILGMIDDITERKRIEEELRKSQKLESLGLLAGGIAHDFNNLMSGVFGYIDLALNTPDRARASTFLSHAMASIGRARSLSAQLLTFATGGAPVQKVGPLFPFVQEAARFALSGATTICKYDLQQDLWPSNFDQNQIGQVIDNIVINAQQAMPAGGTIEMIARNIVFAEKEHTLLARGAYVKITIRDSGIGIPKALLPKIFDPFFTTKTKGHGLGLAICYSIVKRHGGCIEVESEQGKGTAFHLYLPAAQTDVTGIERPIRREHRGNGLFLVLDDEPIVRETLREMLASFGYVVECVENSDDAVAFIGAATKGLKTLTGAIFDLTIPGGKGGRAAVAEVRRMTRELPVFVASGYAEDPIVKNPAAYGFTGSICKPFTKDELADMLNGFFGTGK
jgi:two-component system, cell cycle sensor histidine kinase and response regulator CckA